MTPYVPPRHHLRGGKPRPAESIENQIKRELALRHGSETRQVQVDEISTQWVAVHVPHREAENSNVIGGRRGYCLRPNFERLIAGSIRIGHSSRFGLGLFSPSS